MFFKLLYTKKDTVHIITKNAQKNIASDKQGVFNARPSLEPSNEDSETIKKSPAANKKNCTSKTTTYLFFFDKKELATIKTIYTHSKNINAETESDEWKIAA